MTVRGYAAWGLSLATDWKWGMVGGSGSTLRVWLEPMLTCTTVSGESLTAMSMTHRPAVEGARDGEDK